MSSTNIEARWIEEAKQGNLRAFENLYRTYARQVYGVCRRLTDTNPDAEDLTQAVFLRAWRRLDSFRGDSRFGAWIRRLAVNLMIDERRTLWRRQLDAEEPIDPGADPKTPAPSPGMTLDLERAISLLLPGPRRVLVLHDIEGYTHSEIAEMLGVTTGTTKTQLFRARRALRETLR